MPVRQKWAAEALDEIIIKALTRDTIVTCNTHSNASKLRYALINRLRRQRRHGINYADVNLTVAVKDNIVTVCTHSEELVILSIGDTVLDGNEEHEGRRTSPSEPVSSQGGGGEP